MAMLPPQYICKYINNHLENATVIESNSTFSCEITIQATIESDGTDFNCLNGDHIPQAVLSGSNQTLDDYEDNFTEVISECGFTISSTSNFWMKRILVPLKGVVDGVADGTQSRTLTIRRTLSINSQVVSVEEISSINVSTIYQNILKYINVYYKMCR